MFDAFARADTGHTVIGLANSRPGGGRSLRKLNLLDSDDVSTFIRDTKPNCECFVPAIDQGLRVRGDGACRGHDTIPPPLRLWILCPKPHEPVNRGSPKLQPQVLSIRRYDGT